MATKEWSQSVRKSKNEIINIVLGREEETASMSKSKKSNTTGYITVSSRMHQSPPLMHNIPRPRNENDMSTQAFGYDKGSTLVVDYTSALSCYSLPSSIMHWNYNLYVHCFVPTHYQNGPPLSHVHVSKPPHENRQFPSSAFGGTMVSPSIATILSRLQIDVWAP